jgi:curli biogenesis system outer membrane secretion channel CsgG
MNRRLIGALLVGLIRVTVATGAMAQDAQARPSLAIADIAVAPGGWTLPPPQLSSAIIDLMTNELVSSQRFHVYDGQWLVPEQEAGHADVERLRAAAAERGVDYLVLGSLTGFSTENKKKRIGGIFPKPFVLGGYTRDQAQLKVSLSFRVVDVRTGEVVTTSFGEGLGVRKRRSIGAAGIVAGLPVGALVGAARAAFSRDAMLDDALKQAVQHAALALARANIPTERR